MKVTVTATEVVMLQRQPMLSGTRGAYKGIDSGDEGKLRLR
jgi:hypothetical protein